MKKFLALIVIFNLSLACKKEANSVGAVTDSRSDLVIKSSVITPSFVGNGAQWGGYDAVKTWTGNPTLSDSDWEKLYKRVRFMRPPLVRIMVSPGWNYMINNAFDPSKSEDILVKILNFCQTEGISVMIGEWGHSGGTSIDQSWLENSSKFLDWLINTKKYTCIKYFNMVNEPNGDWSSIKGNYALWKTLIEQFYAKLVEKGLNAKIKLIGPDIAIWNTNSTSWVFNTNFDLGAKIGAYDIHTYPTDIQVQEGAYQNMVKAYRNAAPETKEMLMGELGFKYDATSSLGVENAQLISNDPNASSDSNMMIYRSFYGIDMASALIQNMLAGYSGSMIWDLDDAMYNIDGGGSTKLKRWGFWNILGAEKFGNAADENIRPWFYPMSLMCRYFPGGAKIFDVSLPDKKGLKAVACEKDGKYTIAIVNTGYVSYDVNLKMENGVTLASLNTYKYIAESGASFTGKVDGDGFAVADEANVAIDFQNEKAKTMTIPGKSFFLLTNIK